MIDEILYKEQIDAIKESPDSYREQIVDMLSHVAFMCFLNSVKMEYGLPLILHLQTV